ncbi:MAG: hypothetical protein ACR2G5_01205 [Pyrinomonadaceae bacterium]
MKETWNLACVARLEPAAKSQDLLFQVLALPQWRDRPLQIKLYGSGPCERSLRQLAARLQPLDSIDLKSPKFQDEPVRAFNLYCVRGPALQVLEG